MAAEIDSPSAEVQQVRLSWAPFFFFFFHPFWALTAVMACGVIVSWTQI